MNTHKLELDSNMSLEKITNEINNVLDSKTEGEHSSSPWRPFELSLNCIDLDVPTCAVITRFLLSVQQDQTYFSSSNGVDRKCCCWKSIEIEECSGPLLDAFITTVFTSCRVERIKLTSIYENLNPNSLYGIVLGLQSNSYVQELILSTTVTTDDVRILAQGLNTQTSLRRFCLWDCTLEELETAQILGLGLKALASIQEFGLVACDQCDDERLSSLLQAFYDDIFGQQRRRRRRRLLVSNNISIVSMPQKV